jgi:hypothetical protein
VSLDGGGSEGAAAETAPAEKPRKRGHVIADAFTNHPYLVALSFGLGLVATIISLAQFAFGGEDPVEPPAVVPETTSLSVTAEVFDPQVTAYVLPVTAPLDELPPMPSPPFCTTETIAWLEENGAERQHTWLLSMRNAAEGGTSMLSVSNIRFEEVDTTEPEEPVFVFDCPSAGAAEFVRGALALEEGAVVRTEGDGQPVALNFAPGESVQLQVYFSGVGGSQSALVADVSSGSDTRTETLLPAGEIAIPTLGRYANLIVEAAGDGLFYCSSADFELYEECGADEIAGYAEAWSGGS